jgi:hypothetical protein
VKTDKTAISNGGGQPILSAPLDVGAEIFRAPIGDGAKATFHGIEESREGTDTQAAGFPLQSGG